MRTIERAIFDLRRGLPVLLRGPDAATLAGPVEGLDDAALARLNDLGGHACRLVITRYRLERLGVDTSATTDTAVSVALSTRDDAASVIDRACAQNPRPLEGHTPAPADAIDAAALTLMRRGLLIPAALNVDLAADRLAAVESLVETGELLAVDTSAVAAYAQSAPRFLQRVSSAQVPLPEAEQTRFVLFREADGLREHVALVIGEPSAWSDAVPVRLHSACLTGDLFGSLRCDCGEQLRSSVATIEQRGGGVLLYLAQEGRGIGLANKLRAYGLQDEGLDTVDADHVLGFGEDERDYNVALELLAQLDIRRIELLTNNPAKIEAMSAGGITVVQRRGIYGRLTTQNRRYLTTKAARAGHWLDNVLGTEPDKRAVKGS